MGISAGNIDLAGITNTSDMQTNTISAYSDYRKGS